MKDIISVTVRLTETDPKKLHSDESHEKLELCAQVLEMGNAIALAVSGLTGTEHRVIASEEKMQVSLVYSAPDVSDMKVKEFVRKYNGDKNCLYSSFERSKKELAIEGIDIQTEIIPIETLALPA